MNNSKISQNSTSLLIVFGKILFIPISSVLIIYTVKTSDQIYLPTFIAGLAGLLIGFIEPKKGWIWALLLNTFMVITYLFSGISELKGSKLELEMFSLIGSIFFIFAVSLGGAFIKRA